MKKTLLIVDDLKANREILKHMLSDEYAITEASDGFRALATLRQDYEHISAVLLDISMPGLDGYEVLRAIRADRMTAMIPVIMITGFENEQSRVKALSCGANDFVMKPYSSEIIRHCLHNNIAFHETAAVVDALKRDRVTGLYTREAFFDKVTHLVAAHAPGYYIMACFDIAQFKVINDQYGADKGDEVLRHIASAFADGFAPNGGLCCRISGDHFAVLYPASFLHSDKLAEIRKKASHIDGLIFPIFFSIGRYVIDDLTLPPSSMYDRAVLAANSVKGRYDESIAVYDETMRQHMLHEQEIVTEMEFALSDHQFEIWYQPQYNHSTEARIGAEALVRWNHPRKGLIPPDRFIPVFERNGFIFQLDRFVWEEVCKTLRRWLDEGRSPLPISVNISRYDIYREDLVPVFAALLKKYDLPVELLRLEITESAFVESAKPVIRVMKAFIELGFTVEIDDFGSGYSSLNALKEVPAQVLKLDMKFFENTGDSQRGGNIVESVVRMAKWLGMAVIAEGVENAAQADFLCSLGCNYIQGYLYSRPIPAAQYEALSYTGGKEEKLLALETVENLDNSTFWDAHSLDTLIFNSYVGAACIFEYHNGKIELIRATRKYAQIIGSAGMNIEDAMRIDWLNHLGEKDKTRVIDAIEQSAASKKEITQEYLFLDLPNCPRETYLRSTLRVIARTGNRCMVYCTNEDITAQRQLEKRERELSEQLQAIMKNIDCGVSASVLRDGRLHCIFANDSYYLQLGYTKEDYQAKFKGLPIAVVPEDLERLMTRYGEISAGKKAMPIEFHIQREDGERRSISCSITLMDYPGIDDPVLLSVSTDVTEQRKAERKIRRLSDQMQAIMDNVDLGILAAVVEAGSARYLFANDYYYQLLGYTREQFHAEISSPYETIAPEDRQRVIEITHALNTTGGSTMLEYHAYTRQRHVRLLRSVISMGSLSGVELPVQLTILRDITCEEELAQREREALAQLQTMMDDIPGGFARLHFFEDGSLRPVYLNKGFMNLTGMDYDAMMALYAEDAMAGVHPEDVQIVQRFVEELLSHGEARSARYRLRHGSDGYLWLMIFGRVTKSAAGETFLNIYYSDATREVKAEEQSKELLDNLPCGAALFALNQNELSIIHLNKRFLSLLGRSAQASGDFLAAVYAEDLSVMTGEIKLARRERRDAICDIRVLCGDGEYRPFHMVGRIAQKESGQSAVYAAFTPITPEAMSVQEMLPIALSAMMDLQTDFSFVKDRNLRYISCSRAAATLTGCDSPSAMQGMTDEELFDAALAAQMAADDHRVLEQGASVIDLISRLSAADGSEHYISTSKFPLKDSSGTIVGLFGVGRDITESRTIKSQYELLTNAIPGGIATYEASADGVKLIFFSNGFCQLFSLSREDYIEIAAKNIYAGIFAQDLPELKRQAEEMLRCDTQMDCIFRVRLQNGDEKWVSLKAACAEREQDKIVFHTVLFDVTKRQSTMEQLRISEEEYRLAMQHTSNVVCRYDIADGTLRIPEVAQNRFCMPEIVTNVPQAQVERGVISQESAQAYSDFFQNMKSGIDNGAATFRCRSSRGWRWLEGHYSLIRSDEGKPVSAVVSFADATEQIEKDTAYKRWRQSLLNKRADTFSLFRYNLSTGTFLAAQEGTLIRLSADPNDCDLNRVLTRYAAQSVFQEDTERFSAAVNSDALLSGYYQGKRVVTLEYRQALPNDGALWIRLTVDLVETTGISDIEAYLLFEDIDQAKRQELSTIEQAQTDPLTGVLNRSTFQSQVNHRLSIARPNAHHALLMLDIDNFKRVNDVFGHFAGDQVLIDIATALRTVLEHDDLICRLGGDEYLIFLPNIPGDMVVSAKASQICAISRKSFSAEVEISGSIGIALSPKDGVSFEDLYRKADAALYHLKATGKDSFTFYHDGMAEQQLRMEPCISATMETAPKKKKRRILIVDDSRIDHAMLTNIFADEFIVEKAKNGNDALIRLRHYGTSISVVLLDLMMPGMDGFTVLKKLRQSAELQSIPVIVVSGDDNRETSLRAIREGAVDFVNKPVDPEVLRIRVQSAIGKADNERLRAKNSFLEYQNSEIARYKTALDSSGVVVVENDWVAGTFIYDTTISEHLAGTYDDRSFWQVLLSDFVAETFTVQKMQSLVHEIAADRGHKTAQATVRLKAPDCHYHRFRMSIYKRINEFGLAGKIYITFVDLGAELPSER